VTQDTRLSKRERQKQRRDAKLAEQRRLAARARRNRFIILGLVALVAVAAVGTIVQSRLAEQRARAAQAAEAEARLAELGCTPAEPQPDLGQGHLATDPAALAVAAPETLYPDRPATSGQHYPNWVMSGVYDQPIDERILVHNLEHGYVNLYYGENADPAQVDELRSFGQSQIDGEFPKVIVAPSPAPLSEGVNFSYVAWNVRQACGQFDPDVAQVFVREQMNNENAPERFLQPHLEPGRGTIDPEGEPLLLPPLGQDTVDQPGMEEGASELPVGPPAATES
jgi:uncharacterized protein DUF3105